MKRSAALICLLAAIVLLTSSPVDSRTWNVKVNGSGDAPTIQAAVDSAGTGDEILVHAGRYTWTNQGTGSSQYGIVKFLRGVGGFTIRSVSGAGATILDAERKGRVIYLAAYNEVRFEGFTITGGVAPSFGYFDGGGIVAHLCPAEFVDCVITRNSADGGGGGMWCGGVSSMHFTNCEFSDNEAGSGGGILYVNSYHTARLTNCVIKNNTSTNKGGGVYAHNNSLNFENTVISGNTAAGQGGGLYLSIDVAATFSQCTIAGNDGTLGGGLFLFGSATLNLNQSIVAYNLDGGAFGSDSLSVLTASCNDVFSNGGGNAFPAGTVDSGGNFSLDPQFCGTVGSGQMQIAYDSPCAPGYHPDGDSCGLIGALPIDCGNAPVETTTWGRIKMLNSKD